MINLIRIFICIHKYLITNLTKYEDKERYGRGAQVRKTDVK
jgi:hypothetical protein